MGAGPEGKEWGGVPGAAWLSPEPCRHWSPSGLIEAQVSGDQVLVSVCGAYCPQPAPGTFSCLFLRLPEPWPTPAPPGLHVPVTRRGRGPSPLSSSHFNCVCNKEQLLNSDRFLWLRGRGNEGQAWVLPCWHPPRGRGSALGLVLRRGQLGTPGVISLTAQIQRGCGAGTGQALGKRRMIPGRVVFGGPLGHPAQAASPCHWDGAGTHL